MSTEGEVQQSTEITSFQTFTTETIHRSALKNAAYNPRHLTARGKAKLRASLKAVGLVQPVVWNKRTGNIVGGHQRIAQIDSMEGHANYSLTVAVVDVDETREKELNILLNNQDVGGDWNLDKLKELLTDPALEKLNTGFDDAEIFKLFGKADGQPDSEHQKAIADQLKGVKDAYAKLTAAGCSKDDRDFYGVVIFGSYNQRKEFLDALGLEDNRYIDGRLLLQILRGEKSECAAHGNEGDGAGTGEDEAVVALKPA